MDFKITGQVVFRVHGESGDGRDLVSVTGIIAVPKGSLKSDHQHIVRGESSPSGSVINMQIDLIQPTDMVQELRGMTPDCILLMPIWRF